MDDNLPRRLKDIIQARDFSALHARLESWSPADLATLLVRLPIEDQVIVFRILPEGTDYQLTPGDRLDLPPRVEHGAIVGRQGVTCLEAARSLMLRAAE